MTNQAQKDKKLKELIVYLALRSEGDDYFGATKLNKLLFFADFLAYINFGKAITEQEYQALPQGPAPRRLLPIRDELIAEHRIAFAQREFFGLEQHRIFALREPDLSVFAPEEIDLVNRVIQQYTGVSGSKISYESHLFSGWKYAEKGETIPYEVALVGVRNLTPEEFEYAESLESLAAELLLSG